MPGAPDTDASAGRSGSATGGRRPGILAGRLSWSVFDPGSPVRTAALLAAGAYVALGTSPRAPGPTAWVATALALAVGLALTRFGDTQPAWGPWAVLVAVAGVLATADLAITHVLLLVLLVLSIPLTRLPLRTGAWTGAVGLGLGLLAGLRVRLITGHPGPLPTIALGYAVAFGAVFAVRERRQRQRENERFVAELAREHRELEDAYARLRAYAGHTAELAASEERNRIAREIHDVLAHALTVMIVQAEAAAVRLRADPQGAADQVRAVAELARAALQEARLSVAAMRADPGSAGVAALRRLCEDAGRVGDLRCALAIEGEERTLPAPVALTIYRIAQEAITNARRHGNAREVDLLVRFFAGGVTLRVTDDGGGAGPPQPVPGSGLRGMAERVQALGGAFRAGPRADGHGFEIVGELPLVPTEGEAGRRQPDGGGEAGRRMNGGGTAGRHASAGEDSSRPAVRKEPGCP